MRKFSVLILFLFPALVFGQDKVLFTNGKEQKAYILYQDNKWINYGMRLKKKINERKLLQIEDNYKKKQTDTEKKLNDELVNYKKEVEEKRREKIAGIKLKYSDEKIQSEKIKSINFAIDASINSKENQVKLKQNVRHDLLRRNETNAKARVKYKVTKRALKDNVFSITHYDGREEIIYSPDTLGFLVVDVVEPELDLTVEEMRRYIAGRQDGMKVSGDKAMNVSLMVSAIGGGLGAFYGPIAPSIYMIILGTTKQNPNEKLVTHPEYIFDENYLAGYRKSARKRKIIAAAGGGIIGLGIGIVYYQTAFRGWK